ncbi:hypothetical protein [Legionella londiniensis]|uniref:Coiled-coil protein n=1 Tax=Legionella londiniensis TaxID=45068 RepID=A0A0W0VNT9_9GAMM|nr:hypothetical protein [Legionella londiniensis]KTD21758.1 coiled-coil protein [Legionella londiniensis]STX94367.1 coiled-coil protein [Legionella londiniensis]
MPYAGYSDFLADKSRFFSEVKTKNGAEDYAKTHRYDFLLNNRHLIEQEFHDLFTSLNREQQKSKEFILYCYYCALLLKTFYDAYDKADKVKQYEAYCVELYEWLENEKLRHKVSESYWQRLQKNIEESLNDLISLPQHASNIRGMIGLMNITRLQIAFSRITIQQLLLTAQQLQWIDKLNDLLKIKLDVDKMVGVLNQGNGILNALSVGLFAARFLINGAMLLKHTVFASKKERETSGFSARFKAELSKRDLDSLSDLTWACVNLVTNYAGFFRIPAAAANGILIAFLVFDISILLIRQNRAEQAYLEKKAQYLAELSQLGEGQENQRKWIQAQLDELELNWQVTSSKFNFEIAAAALLMGSFSAAMLLSFPAALPVSFFFCVVAFAMYATSNEYAQYCKASLQYRNRELAGDDSKDVLGELHKARLNFALAMAKNTIMPLLIMGTFAVCWQAAVALTLLFIGYECIKGLLPPKELLFGKDKQEADESSTALLI